MRAVSTARSATATSPSTWQRISTASREHPFTWLDWARRLQAIAQSGLTYAADPFDVERYEAVRAIAGEVAAAGSAAEPERVLELFSADVGHATPKLDVRGFAFREDAVLLVRNRDDGRWSPPGGWVEVGERPSQAVEKEVREETGYSARATALVGVYDHDVRSRPRWPFHAWTLDFLCELTDEPCVDADPRETLEVAFFRDDRVPELSLRTGAGRLARAFAYARGEVSAAYFD